MSLLFRPRMPKRLFYLIVLAASLTLVGGVSWLAGRWLPWGAPLTWVAAIGALLYGTLWERRWIEINHHPLPIEDLPSGLHGLRIVHLSDLHVDAYTTRRWLERVVRTVNALEPDLVVFTGDLVTHEPGYIGPCVEGLEGLRARLGVFAVLGNHDHWAGSQRLVTELRRLGVRVLCNAHARLGASAGDDGTLWLVGVDDPHLKRARLDLALEGVGDGPRVLLSHSPDIIEEAAGRVDVILMGHTHGGQVCFPWVGPLFGATRRPSSRAFLAGMRRAGSTTCYTNRGLGTVLLPIRFNCRPEVAVLTLAPATGRPGRPADGTLGRI